jgi:hypothetical protein
MKEIKYQQKYVRELVDKTIDLLRLTGHRKTLIFKAPTGSGKSAKVLQKINPKVEIRISATPKTNSDHKVTVSREEVVREEMIKKQVVLNPDITKGYNDENELNIHLIQCALQKRIRNKCTYQCRLYQ